MTDPSWPEYMRIHPILVGGAYGLCHYLSMLCRTGPILKCGCSLDCLKCHIAHSMTEGMSIPVHLSILSLSPSPAIPPLVTVVTLDPTLTSRPVMATPSPATHSRMADGREMAGTSNNHFYCIKSIYHSVLYTTVPH